MNVFRDQDDGEALSEVLNRAHGTPREIERVESDFAASQTDRRYRTGTSWVYDWYLHIMFSERLLEAARALNRTQPTDSLGTAVYEFAAHWANFKPLRDVLHHPAPMALKLTSLRVGGDRITYQHEGSEPEWEFTIDELHGPVEDLYAVIKAGNPDRRGGHEDEASPRPR